MSADESMWEVSVQGRDGDLGYLAQHFTSPPIVMAQSDSDSCYVLRLEAFRDCGESTAVLKLAERQLVVLSGILKFERNSPSPLQAGAVFRRRNGGRDVYVHVRETLRLTLEMGEPVVIVTDADGKVVARRASPARALRFAEIAYADPAAEKVMRLFAAPDAGTWAGLYRIYEVVESDVGGRDVLVARNWSSKEEQRRFKHSANSVTVAGDASRHGKENTEPPKNPMTLEEAGAHLEQLVRRWLESKGV